MTEITGGVTETSLGITTTRIWRDAQNDSTNEGVTEMINHSKKDMETMRRRMPESGTETRTPGDAWRSHKMSRNHWKVSMGSKGHNATSLGDGDTCRINVQAEFSLYSP